MESDILKSEGCRTAFNSLSLINVTPCHTLYFNADRQPGTIENIGKSLHDAFENVGAHIANLDDLRNLIASLLTRLNSYQEFIQELNSQMESAEITMRTDIRILINEMQRILRQESIG